MPRSATNIISQPVDALWRWRRHVSQYPFFTDAGRDPNRIVRLKTSRKMPVSTAYIAKYTTMENSIGCRDILRRIDDVQVTNMFKKRFVPRLALASIINQKVMRPILATFTPADTLDETVEFILQGAQKVFCILAYIGFAGYIRKFIEKDGLLLRQVDEDLPFSRGRLRSVADDNLFINCFYEKQWQFCAPVISQRIIPRTLEDETVLPFLKSEYSGEGGFGVITKITIHPEHKSAEILPIENVCLTLSCRAVRPWRSY